MIFLKLFQPLGNDFVVYFEAAKMFLLGLNPYYGLFTRTFPFNYPPTSFFFIFWLGFFDFITANILWNIFSTFSVIISIFLIIKIAKIKTIYLLPLSILLTVFFFPVKFNIGNAQINHFVLLFTCLGLYFYLFGRKNFAALFLAYAATIKIAPIIFLLYFFIRKDFAAIWRFFVFATLIILVSFIFVPINFQLVYLRDVFPLSFTTGAKDWYYNQSLWGFLARSLPNQAQYLFYPIAVLILFLTWWRGQKINWRCSLAAVSCLYLLIHPVALQHYFGFAIIPIILLWDKKHWLILTTCYLLLAYDIKNFAAVPKEFNFILSHDFYAVLILWIFALWKENYRKILSVLWVFVLIFAYVYYLIGRAGLG